MQRFHRSHRVSRRSAGCRHTSSVRATPSAQANAFAAEKQAVSAQGEANRTQAAELDAAARKQQQDLARAIQEGVQKQLVSERRTITEQESARARQRVEDELRTQREAANPQSERIQALTQKLTTAQAAQADLLKKEHLFEDRARELTLDVQKGIAAGLEIALEHQLRAQFPFDLIEPVAKGEFDGYVLQHVRDHTGQICGKILWKSQRTKASSDSWLTKLKGDQGPLTPSWPSSCPSHAQGCHPHRADG